MSPIWKLTCFRPLILCLFVFLILIIVLSCHLNLTLQMYVYVYTEQHNMYPWFYFVLHFFIYLFIFLQLFLLFILNIDNELMISLPILLAPGRFMQQNTSSSLVQIMAWCLFNAKLLSVPNAGLLSIGPWGINVNEIWMKTQQCCLSFVVLKGLWGEGGGGCFLGVGPSVDNIHQP